MAQFGNEILVADVRAAAFQRLGLSHSAFELFFVCPKKQLGKKIAEFSWQRRYKKNFKVTCHHIDSCIERSIAQQVAEKLKNPIAEMEKKLRR